MKMKRPVMRYHGAKWRLAPKVIASFPSHRTYVEPFGGSGAVLLRKPRSYAEVYNDLFGDVVNVFRVLRDPVLSGRLHDACVLTPFARAEFESPIDMSDPVEWARGVIFRSYAGFGSGGANADYNTGFRSSVSRSGTTPSHDWAGWPESIPAFTQRLRGVVIECRPAVDVMLAHDSPSTLHYVDPPYLHSTRGRGNRSVYAHEMSDTDHEGLLAALMGLKGMVVLSGYASPLYDRMLSGWGRREIRAMADGAVERTEVLWMNQAAMSANPSGPIFDAILP